MSHKIWKSSLLILLSAGSMMLQAQQTISATGGNASGSGGSVSFTVGQVVYTAHTGFNGSVLQGVQQPYEISVADGIEEANEISVTCSAYPNPVQSLLTLKVEKYEKGSLLFKLYDIHGKLLLKQKVTGSETSIPMENLAGATYFLRINDKNKEIKSFKIIKN